MEVWQISEKRFKELLERVKAAPFAGQKTTVIKTATPHLAFTCKQMAELLGSFTTDKDKQDHLKLFRKRCVDPKNHEEFSKTLSFQKKECDKIISEFHPCKTEGISPDQFPVVKLPYTSVWHDDEINKLIEEIKAATFADKMVKVCEEKIKPRPEGLSAEQIYKIFSEFKFVDSIIKVTEICQEKLLGLYCSDLCKLLQKAEFEDKKLEMLKAFRFSILDALNKFVILDSFGYSDSKEKARKLLEEVQPISFLFGTPNAFKFIKKFVFVIDLSNSMTCTFKLNTGKTFSRLDFVKEEIVKTIKGFPEDASFNILGYADNVMYWSKELKDANPENVGSAIKYARSLKVCGGTNIHDALKEAFAIPDIQAVFFLTDGMPSVGITDRNTIVNHVKEWSSKNGTIVNSIAFLMGNFQYDDKPGSRTFMRQLADVTGGTYRSIESN
mmetsp:Transcript_27664/g.24328  ORF Transcript_27664/g.24328 Transcript_27664/m.24328 type:complete len:441 (-) Transcript_27664:195-1517(-)